jgi:NADH:ubiquinone oxidoreductase subunit 5 (subunit L)/multisubunit Na+/H+ antiporter MnhA subunit
MELAVVVIPFVLAGVVPVVAKRVPRNALHWLLAGAMLALFVWLLTLLPTIHDGGPITINYPWVPALNLSLDLYIDGLALLFALLITGIGAAVFLYAGYYLDGDERAPTFLALLSAFAGSMLGVVLAGNLLLLFVCWELTSVFSFTLIGFDRERPEARSAALQALVVTGGGGLALLVGLILLGSASGSFTFPQLLQTGLQDHPWYTAITTLILLGCFTKSAQVPFHFWLPGSMTAPTPASAYLHSATMVKAGVYLLARLYPTLANTTLWLSVLVTVGLLTMLVGALIALRQRDLKGLLAYATVSWLGALVLLLGLPGYEGYTAALVGIVGHALYKSPLFMVAGAIDHATGTRIIDRLGGLARRMPTAAAIAVVSALSMAGVIPLMGFVAKETLLDALLEYHGAFALLILAGVVVAASLTVTAAWLFVWDVFFRPAARITVDQHVSHGADAALGHFHAPARLMLLGPGLIAIMSLVAALRLESQVTPLLEATVPVEFSLHLFNGFNTAFAISLGALSAGTLLFVTRNAWVCRPLPRLISGAEVYGSFMGLLNRLGDLALRLQDGKLSHYLVVILGVVGVLVALPGYKYLSSAQLNFSLRGSSDVMKGVLLLLALGSTLASILFRGHLLAAFALGVAGYAVGGIFLLEPAPDVALVQILVETLAAVLLIVMLSRISERKRKKAADAIWGGGRPTVRRDLLVSVLVGGGIGVFALAAVVNRPARQSTVADWYLQNAYAEVGVTDVVGSIITDFRGTDTLLEITVFSIAALGALTVLSLTRTREPDEGSQTAEETSRISTPLTRGATTLFLPFAVVIALAQLLYAGDTPGDGFTAGVIGGISVALWYQVFGYNQQGIHALRAGRLIGVGMALALANALLPLLFGDHFLQHNNFGDIPLPAGLHVSSTTIFEIAIALTVFGSMINIINAITHPEGIETR